MLAENTLLKTAYHFLLLLVGFDTLTYRKGYDRSPTLVGHQLTRSTHNSEVGTSEICDANGKPGLSYLNIEHQDL